MMALDQGDILGVTYDYTSQLQKKITSLNYSPSQIRNINNRNVCTMSLICWVIPINTVDTGACCSQIDFK